MVIEGEEVVGGWIVLCVLVMGVFVYVVDGVYCYWLWFDVVDGFLLKVISYVNDDDMLFEIVMFDDVEIDVVFFECFFVF